MGKRRTSKTAARRGCSWQAAVLIVCGVIGLSVIGSMNKNRASSSPTRAPTEARADATATDRATEEDLEVTSAREESLPTATSAAESRATLMQQARETSDAAPTEANAPATARPTDVPPERSSNQSVEVREISSVTYYTTGSVNVRECPSTSCTSLGQTGSGIGLTVDGEAEGDAVTAGNTIWYRVAYNGHVGYVYSGLMSRNAPVVNTSGSTSGGSTGGSGAQTNAHPGNCSTAVAMGLSAQQAAAEGLDRDGDGEACYGN